MTDVCRVWFHDAAESRWSDNEDIDIFIPCLFRLRLRDVSPLLFGVMHPCVQEVHGTNCTQCCCRDAQHHRNS